MSGPFSLFSIPFFCFNLDTNPKKIMQSHFCVGLSRSSNQQSLVPLLFQMFMTLLSPSPPLPFSALQLRSLGLRFQLFLHTVSGSIQAQYCIHFHISSKYVISIHFLFLPAVDIFLYSFLKNINFPLTTIGQWHMDFCSRYIIFWFPLHFSFHLYFLFVDLFGLIEMMIMDVPCREACGQIFCCVSKKRRKGGKRLELWISRNREAPSPRNQHARTAAARLVKILKERNPLRNLHKVEDCFQCCSAWPSLKKSPKITVYGKPAISLTTIFSTCT